MKPLVLVFFFLFFVVSAKAESYADKLESHIENNLTGRSPGIIEVESYELKQEYKNSFSFLNYYKEQTGEVLLFNDLLIKALSNTLLADEQLLMIYDESFSESQEFCYTNEDIVFENSCTNLLENFELINEVLDAPPSEETTNMNSSIISIELDSEQVTYRIAKDEDPNFELMQESNETPNRYSIQNKGEYPKFITSEKTVDLKRLEQTLCITNTHLESQDMKLLLGLNTSMIEELKVASVNENILLEKRLEVWCTLKQYYETIGDGTDGILFIYFNMPSQEINCEEL